MPSPQNKFVSFTLHSHLPYVVNHGTWPHGLEWLLEAAAETYLPLLRVMGELEAEGLALRANVNLSPILLEQMAHPVFKEEFPRYLKRKIEAAQVDEMSFLNKGESQISSVAIFWQEWYQKALADFEHWNGDIISGFRRFNDSGAIEVFTCAATHGYFPLLGTDSAIRAQIRTGIATHERHLGRRPRGFWLPECGYRPRGVWKYPVKWAGSETILRSGVEELLAEERIDYFFVDSHMLENSAHFFPYELTAGRKPRAFELDQADPRESYNQPFYAGVPGAGRPVAFFTRDPRTSVQVWSGEMGYPGDGAYLEFHKKHWPGGNRYWRVTSPRLDLGLKLPYVPETASAHTHGHAQHFVKIAEQAIERHPAEGGVPPILTAPFDAELFGHWWFEGPQFLKQVARELSSSSSPLRAITCGEYLDRFTPKGQLQLEEGSWGRNGTNEVWLNSDNAWTWPHIYEAEAAVSRIAREGRWCGNENATRLVKQMCRELLLMESSDWQFLITMKDARDYAEKRFTGHLQSFIELQDIWHTFTHTNEVPESAIGHLDYLESSDSVFQNLNPEDWT